MEGGITRGRFLLALLGLLAPLVVLAALRLWRRLRT
jgi:hypothetical protein